MGSCSNTWETSTTSATSAATSCCCIFPETPTEVSLHNTRDQTCQIWGIAVYICFRQVLMGEQSVVFFLIYIPELLDCSFKNICNIRGRPEAQETPLDINWDQTVPHRNWLLRHDLISHLYFLQRAELPLWHHNLKAEIWTTSPTSAWSSSCQWLWPWEPCWATLLWPGWCPWNTSTRRCRKNHRTVSQSQLSTTTRRRRERAEDSASGDQRTVWTWRECDIVGGKTEENLNIFFNFQMCLKRHSKVSMETFNKTITMEEGGVCLKNK